MEQLKEIAKTSQQESVRNKILELIQAWAYAFRDSSKYRAVQVSFIAVICNVELIFYIALIYVKLLN